MSGYPNQYTNNWQQPGYVQPGYVQPGFVQPGQQCYGQQCYGQPQQRQGVLGNVLHRDNRDRSRSSSSSHGSPSRRAQKQQRRQMREQQRQQGFYNNGMGYQQPGFQQGPGGIVQGLRNKVDNVIHGNRRFWSNWMMSILNSLLLNKF